jgi:transcriptional regulator with XRE-family HTH domain
MNNKNIFAKNLKRYMDISKKSRREVSEALGVSYYTFSDWVNGKKYPRMDKVEMLADYFGILKSDLIEEKTIENSPVEMAERHFEIIMDEDIADIFDDFKVLDGQQRQLVKDLVHNLAQSKKSEA